MKVVVTGAAGFIGSNIVRRLNKEGVDGVLLVDRVDAQQKVYNVRDLKFADIVDYDDPDLSHVVDEFRGSDELVVFHQGACSDTMATDHQMVWRLNYEKSKWWLDYCMFRSARLIYASSAAVYGAGEKGFKPGCESPFNVYGLSKAAFDAFVQRQLPNSRAQVAGLRYFNVYGPGEVHKGKMSSSILQFYGQSLAGAVNVFRGSQDFKRDFIYIDDVIDANMHLMKTGTSGLFNCGTGIARSFMDVARNVVGVGGIMSADRFSSKAGPTVKINEIDMPFELRARYQKFTQADTAGLAAVGFSPQYVKLEDGIQRYIKHLEDHGW